jgi:hypothetical protein
VPLLFPVILSAMIVSCAGGDEQGNKKKKTYGTACFRRAAGKESGLKKLKPESRVAFGL